MRCLIDLSTRVKLGYHKIYLNSSARADIHWWLDFLPGWNRTTIIPDSLTISNEDIRLYTDASGIGLGAIYGPSWIQAKWPYNMPALITGKAIDIDYLELFAIFAACATWGHLWAGKCIVISTDNAPITDVWHTGFSRSKPLMHLVRRIFLEAATHQFSLSLKYIPGTCNAIADTISRFQMVKFKELAPDTNQLPTDILAVVWDIIYL